MTPKDDDDDDDDTPSSSSSPSPSPLPSPDMPSPSCPAMTRRRHNEDNAPPSPPSTSQVAHAREHVYTHRVTSASVCALAGMCSYPWVNLCGYGYGYPPAYPSENPYPYGGYGFLPSTGMGTAPDTRGLPVLLPTYVSRSISIHSVFPSNKTKPKALSCLDPYPPLLDFIHAKRHHTHWLNQ